jgi:GT2 family glycosyltransferase
VLFRREAFIASAGFDEEVGHFWEDTAAGYAVLRVGWREAWAPDALVHHDVTYPGLPWHLRRAQRHRNLAAVLRKCPELRDELLWRRYFLRPRNAKVAAAALGAALSVADRRWLALLVPYLLERGPNALTRDELGGFADRALFDTAVVVGVVRGAVRHRCLVI